MRRTLLLVLAMIGVLVSLMSGVAVLRTDVVAPVDSAAYEAVVCGSVYAVVLDGGAVGGGEVRRPDDAACLSQARMQLRWAALPLIAGLLALGYIGLRWRDVVRESAGRSNHPEAEASSRR